MASLRIPAAYMRGGTSKGVFFRAEDLPGDAHERDRILLRVIGSPDPYGKQIDGMGAATSSTSKVVILARSGREDSDVDFQFGQVAIDRALIDWSGNCGNLTAAVGPFALRQGWVERAPADGIAVVRIWQRNIGKRIVSSVPMRGGAVDEEGEFMLDGVAFPAAEIRVEFLDPGGMEGQDAAAGGAFPTGHLREILEVPGLGAIEATLVNAGNPTVFVSSAALGLTGTEMQAAIDGDAGLLARAEALRSHAAVAMGLAASPGEATRLRPHTPKVALVAPPAAFVSSSGQRFEASAMDLTVRMLSMGKLHHAITGTGAVAAAVACAIPGTVAGDALRTGCDPLRTRIAHPSGVLAAGAEAVRGAAGWSVTRVVMSRSARLLMEGWVLVPQGRPR